MRRRPLLALALLAVLLLSACGGGTTVGGGNDPAQGSGGPRAAAFDPRDAPLGCIRGNGVEADKDPRRRDRLIILPAASGAYVEFAATASEAQGRQIRNEAPGAQVIGPHLFTVGDLTDAELAKVERCLTAQGAEY